MPTGIGTGRSVAVIGAGIAGFTAAYELLQAGFDVTVYEAEKRYGGRSLTVRPSDPDYKAWYLANSRFVRADSYCDFISAEVRGAMVGEQTARFVPSPTDDGYFELAFNAGPGRIPTYHTGVLHYCRSFGVEMAPYIFRSQTNLLQADNFNGGAPVQFRQVRYDLEGYLAEMLHATAGQAVAGRVPADTGAAEKLQQLLVKFGDLSSNGRFNGTTREGYVVPPGAGTNSGIRRTPLALEEILNADSLWPELFAPSAEDWQLPLLEPVGGMDMIWQAFLAQRVGGAELRERVRLAHEVTGMRYADASNTRIVVSYKSATDGPGEATHDYVIMTGAPLFAAQMDLQDLLDDGVEDMLKSSLYYRGGKYGVQARSRFWEAQDVQIFGGISWTDHMSGQLWYPSSGYNGPTGLLTGAYPQDRYSTDAEGNVYLASDYRTPLDPSRFTPSDLSGSRWAELNHQERVDQALIGCEALHPGFRQHIYAETGLSISWDNQPFQLGIDATHLPVSRPEAYARLIQPIDRTGRVYLAGDYLSYVWGWQEGAVRSAWWTVGLLRDHVLAQGG